MLPLHHAPQPCTLTLTVPAHCRQAGLSCITTISACSNTAADTGTWPSSTTTRHGPGSRLSSLPVILPFILNCH